MVIDNEGTKLEAMTFNGTIPGPAIVRACGRRCRADAGLSHNIDFHAATGALGAATRVASTR